MELGAGRLGDVRQKLDALGFCQPLTTGALGLVGAILEDLLKTTDSLKKLKNENKQLLEVRILIKVAFLFIILFIFFIVV